MGSTMSVRVSSTAAGTDSGCAVRTSAGPAMVERPANTLRSSDAMVAFDADLTIVSSNRAVEDLTGVSREEAVGRHCWEVRGGRDDGGNLVCHAGFTKAAT
jgi:PAS domain-containing protein